MADTQAIAREFICRAVLLAVALVAGFFLLSSAPPESVTEVTDSQIVNEEHKSGRTQDAAAMTSDEPSPDAEPTLSEPDETSWRISMPEGRARIQNSPGPPSAPLIELYDDLVFRANSGDTDAALFLAMALDFCADFPTTEQAYDDQILRLLTTRRVPWPGIVDDTTEAESVITQGYFVCKGISADKIQQAKSFLWLAAEGGNSSAQVKYSRSLFATTESLETLRNSGVVDRAQSLLTTAYEAGNIRAAYLLADYELKGVFLSADQTEVVAKLIIAGSAYSQHGILNNLQRKAEREYLLLTPQQQDEALRIARGFIESDECCHFSYGPLWREMLADR